MGMTQPTPQPPTSPSNAARVSIAVEFMTAIHAGDHASAQRLLHRYGVTLVIPVTSVGLAAITKLAEAQSRTPEEVLQGLGLHAARHTDPGAQS